MFPLAFKNKSLSSTKKSAFERESLKTHKNFFRDQIAVAIIATWQKRVCIVASHFKFHSLTGGIVCMTF
jgi:hypothetical protein